LFNSKNQASSNAKWHNNSYGLGNTTIKLEQRKDLKNARKKGRKKQLT
jgi:hypothetical protein